MRMPMFVLLGTGVILACTSPTSLCGCSPLPYPNAIVVGTVRTSAEAPVSGVLVSARSSRGRCPVGSQSTTVGLVSMPTDATGRYRLGVGGLGATVDSICVQVYARRSTSARADTLFSAMVPMQLRVDPPYDSTLVDLRFP